MRTLRSKLLLGKFKNFQFNDYSSNDYFNVSVAIFFRREVPDETLRLSKHVAADVLPVPSATLAENTNNPAS